MAFLRDLYIDNDWTARFARILDEHLILPKEGKILYVEPGGGIHLLALSEKLSRDVELLSVHEDIELLRIAEAKAQALKIEIDFRQSENNRLPFPDEEFPVIIADASFVLPSRLPAFLAELNRTAKKDGLVSFFLPTAGSFGEFFSLFWEALYKSGMENFGAQVEELINEIPTVSQIEAIAGIAGLKDLKSVTKSEFFDYENGAEFMNSFLATEFLLPRWLRFLTTEQTEKIVPEVIRTIDEDINTMTFRLSIKATVVSGKKG